MSWLRPRQLLSSRIVEEIIASGALSPARLQESLASSLRVKRSLHGLFMYSEEGRGIDVGSSRFACELVTMSPRELFEACEKTEVFHYFTTRLNVESRAWQDLVERRPGSYCSVWIGGEGSTTQAHYDVADNVLMQGHGRKRVRLWPPTAHFDLQVFPDSHPRARKAQALVREADRATVDIVLEPGDAVEIPAFWFHHCEALDTSVSFNVFAPSKAAGWASSCFATSMPTQYPQDLPQILSHHLEDPHSFLTKFYQSRFAPLEKEYAEALSAPSKNKKGHQRPISPLLSSRKERSVDDDTSRREAALERCREAAGPEAADGVTEIVLAHLIELWGMQLTGHDSPALAAMLKREINDSKEA